MIGDQVTTIGREGGAPAAELVGREAELDRLDAFLDDREALPAAILIEGPAGAGKTTLWRATLDRAGARGYRVLACRPAGAEIQLAYSALSDLLEPRLDAVLPTLPAPQRRALEIALLLHGDDGTPPDRRAIAAGFLTAIRALAHDGDVLLAVDDAQWLDEASAEVIEYAVRRLGGTPVALVASWRTGSPTARADGSSQGLQLARALEGQPKRLVVGPMSLGATHRLLRTRTSLDFNRRTLQRIHETSGGNPFYALELASAMERNAERSAATDGEPLPLSAGLEALLAARVRDLPTRTREALFVAAAVSSSTLELIARAIGVSPDDAVEALRPAEAAAVVRLGKDAVKFVHPLFAAAAYGAVDATDRGSWHARIAEAAPDPETRARHLALATPGADEQVARLLHDAAGHAVARGAGGDAAELATAAIERHPISDADARSERAEWIVEAAPWTIAAGAADTARAYVEWALDVLPPGPTRSGALLLLAELIESDPGSGHRTTELLKGAIAEAGSDLQRRAAALLAREMQERARKGLDQALPLAREALAAAEGSGNDRLLAEALVRVADLEVLLGLGGEPTARFQRAREAGARVRVDAENSALTMLAVCLIRAGRLDEARPLLVEERARAVAEGDEASVCQIDLFLAELSWLAGRWDNTVSFARDGVEVAEQAGNRAREGIDLTMLALAEASRGDPERARSIANRARELCEDVDDIGYVHYARQVLAFLELSLGNAAAAVEHLETFRIGRGIEGPKRIAFIGEGIEALVLLGDIDRAAALTEEIEARGRDLHRPPLSATAARCRALVLAARGDLDAGMRSGEESVATFERLGHPFEHARSLLVLGEIQRRAKQRRAARETLARAIEAFDLLGAHLWSKRATAERARVGGRSTIEGLTETEARVATLVAEGKSNKEVAAELFVTVRAVEANLSKVYAKLGIRSRTELARRI